MLYLDARPAFDVPQPQDEPAALRTLTYGSSNPYELQFGYSRAVRKGPYIFVSGTTSVDPESGHLRHPDSAYLQALVIFDEIINAVVRPQGTKNDVARVRMFVTEQQDTEAVGRVLKESFGDVRPAATMIVGSRFVDKDMKVEIEADAVVLV
jgi:enamine deaminase RidA (YjgF/YER057c/UK114 family)